MAFKALGLGKTSHKKNQFLSGIAQITAPPHTHTHTIRASCTTFFGRQKRRLVRITKPSNDDYDNDVNDHNFGTFDDFGVKND